MKTKKKKKNVEINQKQKADSVVYVKRKQWSTFLFETRTKCLDHSLEHQVRALLATKRNKSYKKQITRTV